MPVTDPFRSYNFKLDINGVSEGHFTECSGLSVKIESIAYREAGNNQIIRHIPGPVEYASVTLKYGVTKSHDLWDWIMKAAQGNVVRKNVDIVLLDPTSSSELMHWTLQDAWPSEWQGAALNASEKSIAIETLTLVYDRLERSE